MEEEEDEGEENEKEEEEDNKKKTLKTKRGRVRGRREKGSYSPTQIPRTQWGNCLGSSAPCSVVKKNHLFKGLLVQLLMILIDDII